MDKYGEEEEIGAQNKYVFKNIINQNSPKILKSIRYFKFKKFAIPIIEKNNYDFIIVWNDVAIFMFADYLSKNWKGKYCLNIRDYLYQNKPFLRQRYKNVIKNSAFTTISSDGYKSFLPSFDYLHVHSLNKEVLSTIVPRKSFKKNNQPIRVSFIGNVRFFDINKKLLDIFKNDKRFVMQFFGTNSNVLEKYSFENGINNTIFHDTFKLSETANYINKTDLVNNLYGYGTIDLDYALSIKLYHGLYNRTPILVFHKTYMAEIIKKYKIGYVVEEINIDLPNKIYEWYINLNFKEFNSNCELLLREIRENEEEFELKYQQFIKR